MDLFHFSRRNSRGLVELEDLRDAGARIISAGEGVDSPDDDGGLKIQLNINRHPTRILEKVKMAARYRLQGRRW